MMYMMMTKMRVILQAQELITIHKKAQHSKLKMFPKDFNFLVQLLKGLMIIKISKHRQLITSVQDLIVILQAQQRK